MEFVRHRVFSFAQESTRYCNYSKTKFDNQITFIIPSWLNLPERDDYAIPTLWSDDFAKEISKIAKDEQEYYTIQSFLTSLGMSEDNYLYLIENKDWKPQQARAVLPNSLKTELIMTGTIDQWKGFFELRDAKDAHPQARELAKPLHEEFIRKGYLKE